VRGEQIPTFYELVDLLRSRIGVADAIKDGELHSFKTLMSDRADVIADQWYWKAFDELETLGHLDPASHKEFGGDACGRLSAKGDRHLRASGAAGD
jgi:hypothetical protein